MAGADTAGDVVLVVDGIALLFLHAHQVVLRAGYRPHMLGTVTIVHVPFSSDAQYLQEGWVREAVPGDWGVIPSHGAPGCEFPET